MPTVSKQKVHSPHTMVSTKNSILDELEDAWPEEYLQICLYGDSGTGKTVLWSGFPGPILVAVCSGGKKPGELKSIDTPEMRKKVTPKKVRTCQDVKNIIDLCVTQGYKTLVLDHASGLSDLALCEVLGLEELPAQKSWGMAKIQEYGQATLMVKTILREMLGLSCHTVIVAQEKLFKPKGDDEGMSSEIANPMVGPNLSDKVVAWLRPACDYVVQTFKKQKVKKIKRVVQGKEVITSERVPGVDYCLRTGPNDSIMTKFRILKEKANLLPDCIVNPTYDKIVSVINGEYKEGS